MLKPRDPNIVRLESEGMSTVTGQIMYLNCEREYAIPPPMTMVQIHPPMKPSTVFLGDNRIRGVLPHSMPQIYANISFVMTRHTGRKMELTMKCAWKTTSNSVICVQQNCVNWYAYEPGVNVITKNTNPTGMRSGQNKGELYLWDIRPPKWSDDVLQRPANTHPQILYAWNSKSNSRHIKRTWSWPKSTFHQQQLNREGFTSWVL
jgi:hypothetical protein